MAKHRIQLATGFAALVIVLSAAAYSSSASWRRDFAQYPGVEQPVSTEDFRFVIVGDRTATPEWGLMPQTFDEINHLCPDFVISVGDLIDGYGDKNSVIQGMWQEFDSEVATLKSPFVYVPGNHDIWNATSRGIYETRYGPTYRSFNYRGIHFITLDTEEHDQRGQAIERIAGKQLEWFRQDLVRHRNAQQILIFMHRPVWQTGGLNAVYPMLAGLRVHIFAGHHHRYSFEKFHDIPHIVMSAVAGSMTGRECVESGNFRHYAFATVRGGDLKLALVRLGGVLSPYVTLPKGNG